MPAPTLPTRQSSCKNISRVVHPRARITKGYHRLIHAFVTNCSVRTPNDPKTSSLVHRTNSILTDEVSDASAATRVVVIITSAIDAAVIERLLTTVWAMMQAKIEKYGDGRVSSVTSRNNPDRVIFRAWSHVGTTMTFRCLHDAIVAIYEKMTREGMWGKGTFVIYSGGVEVGKATISTT